MAEVQTPQNGTPLTPLIKRVEIENYGVVKHADLELAPITVLYGPNGGGKTTIINAVECAVKRAIGRECKPISNTGVIKLILDDGEVTYYVGDDRAIGGTSLQLMKALPVIRVNVGRITMRTLCSTFSELMSDFGVRAIWDVLSELKPLLIAQKDGVLYDYDFIYDTNSDLDCSGELVKLAIKEGYNYGINKYKNLVDILPVSESEVKFATLVAYAYMLYRKFVTRGITPVMLLEKPESGFHVSTLVDLFDALRYFDVQLIVETHSGLVLHYGIKHGIAYLVKNGEVKRLTSDDLHSHELFHDEYKALLAVYV